MAKHTFFITGTDTGVGKTTISCGLLSLANSAGLRTLAMKPIASGCEQTADGLRNDDALALQACASEPLSYERINPIAMAPAIAPHVAARQAGKSLSADRLAGFCRGLMMVPGDLLLIEGAGGWRVPLNERETYADVPKALGVPVILVVGLRLGAINQALLSAEAIARDGLRLAGWVANQVEDTPMEAMADTLEYLRGHMGAPCLGHVPYLAPEPGRSAVAEAALCARHLALPDHNKP
ncbi:MAG: dethiobiotin synthase [Halomonadaceae bacterium]|nr:MAG: dethiobiotin synthase [Halomonadaceae bacterium]